MLRFLFFATLIAFAKAQAKDSLIAGNFTSNGTEKVGWISSPPGRSTSSIIWSCVTVLLVCTYKCVHLNLPSLEENEAGWHRVLGVPIWPEWPMLRKNLRQVKWMAVILIVPELGVSLAYKEYKMARLDAKRSFRGQKMTLAHGFFALMGGFVAEYQTSYIPFEETDSLAHDARSAPIREILTLDDYLSRCDNTDELIVTEGSINDRSKADVFTKIFAIVQSTWLVAQSISRVYVGLPITELELATIAYIFCALLMYVLWWNKPFGAEQPVIIKNFTPKNDQTRAYRMPIVSRDDFWNFVFFDESWNDGKYTGRNGESPWIFYLTATIFSALHLFAWNWEFPNPQSLLAWRVFAVMATSTGPCLVLITFIAELLPLGMGWAATVIPSITIIIFTLAYFIARIGLLVLIPYAFIGMPADVYKTVEWSAYFPHFS